MRVTEGRIEAALGPAQGAFDRHIETGEVGNAGGGRFSDIIELAQGLVQRIHQAREDGSVIGGELAIKFFLSSARSVQPPHLHVTV